MKKFANSVLFLSLTLAPLCAAAQTGPLENVLARTDSALAEAFLKASQTMPPFTVPPPVSISGDNRASDTPAADYLPLNQRAVYEYEYTSSEFTGVKTVRVEYLEYSQAERSVKVNMIIFAARSKPRVSNFVVTAGPAGIRSSDSPLSGPRLEIPFPLAYNQVWNEGSDRNRVAALNAKAAVPAGTFDGCLKITTKLGGGDSGAAERYYAPGVGLVYEQIISEDRQEAIRLTSYQLKYSGMN
ncbi:MAG: hypothetical protein A2X35_11085 [Elusimicrobia bacterium GWA2_61_42]|nr:MAG: hypothetical protein A2X35_11085 [Elusimicrobia bacterium GWA2_61_42]OGR75915.1 MAG: hypothetical protein A2X38_07830 [Elusimicrobia bacterium GWC2_61_25]